MYNFCLSLHAGTLHTQVLAISTMPFASLPIFFEEKDRFEVEHSAGLYSWPAFIAAVVTLEILFNAFSGAVFGGVVWVLADYRYGTAFGYVGIMSLAAISHNVRSQ